MNTEIFKEYNNSCDNMKGTRLLLKTGKNQIARLFSNYRLSGTSGTSMLFTTI